MASETYTGAGGAGGWTNPKNWNHRVVPGAGDSVLLSSDLSATISGDGDVNNVMVLDDANVTFTGTLTVGGWGSGTGFMVCEGAQVVFAAGAALQDGGQLQVGVNGTGALLADDASLSSALAIIGKTAIASGTVTLNGSSWADTGDMRVGAAGSGDLRATDASTITVGGNFYLGLDAGAVGQTTLAGGSSLSITRGAFIGLDGAGTLTVDEGSSLTAGILVRVGAEGHIVLAGGSIAAEGTSPISGAAGISIAAGGTISGYGTLSTPTDGQFHDNGLIEADGGTMHLDADVVGLGAMQIDAGASVVARGALRLAEGITFAGAGATLTLAHDAGVSSILYGFAAGDLIEMPGIDKAQWNGTTHYLTLSEGGHPVDWLHLSGTYAADAFSVTQAGGLGVVSVG